jgi:uncharacterized protein YjbJ (UPF0337 family)
VILREVNVSGRKGCGMNQDIPEGKWKQLHGLAKVKRGKLTDDELDQTKGNYEILVGKIDPGEVRHDA